MAVSYGIRRAERFGAVRGFMQLCIQEIGHEGVHDLPDQQEMFPILGRECL